MRGSAIGILVAAAAGMVVTRFMRSKARKNRSRIPDTPITCRRPLNIVVLNPRDGSVYNSTVVVMLKELFAAASVRVKLIEVDVYPRDAKFPEWDAFDGVIVPGSPASAYDDDVWIHRLFDAIRELDQRAMPTIGICFGHQVHT